MDLAPQDLAVLYVVASTNACLSLLAVIQLLRLTIKRCGVPAGGVTGAAKAWFHFIVMICTMSRSAAFFVYATLQFDLSPPVLIMSLSIPDFLFFLAYFMLLLFWIAIYFDLVAGTERHFFYRMRFYIALLLGVLVLGESAFLFMLFQVDDADSLAQIDLIGTLFISILYIATAAGFFVTGFKLYKLLVTFRVPSAKKKTQAKRVGLTASVCTLFFLAKAALAAVSVINSVTRLVPFDNASTHTAPNMWLVATYFVLLETLPTALMCFVMRPRAIVPQYAPISFIQTPPGVTPSPSSSASSVIVGASLFTSTNSSAASTIDRMRL